jgi:hypothetical protein
MAETDRRDERSPRPDQMRECSWRRDRAGVEELPVIEGSPESWS